MKKPNNILSEILHGDVGRGIYEAEGTTQLNGMIPIDGVHQQCNLIFAQAIRRICGDYMENKCEIIPLGLDTDINELTENVLANDTLMKVLNQTIAMEYDKMYDEDYKEPQMYSEDYKEPQMSSPMQVERTTKENNNNTHEVVEMDYFDI